MVCWSGAVSLKLREKWLQTYSHTVLLPKPVKFDVLSSFGDFTFFQLVFGFKLHGMSQKSLFYSFKFKRSNNLENCVHNYLKRPDFIQKLKPKTFKETSKNKKFNPNKSDLHLLKKISIDFHSLKTRETSYKQNRLKLNVFNYRGNFSNVLKLEKN